MKSWRFTGTNEPLQLTDLPEPTAGPGQVVVDVKAAGICHTDVGILTDPGWIVFCQVGVGRFGVSFSPCERRVSGRFGVGRSCWLLVIALVIA